VAGLAVGAPAGQDGDVEGRSGSDGADAPPPEIAGEPKAVEVSTPGLAPPTGAPAQLEALARASFAERRAELELLHRQRRAEKIASDDRSGSWLYRWARALIAPPRGRRPVGPPPPIPLPSTGECVITFVGHATLLLRYAHARLLTDPCFARSLYSLRRAQPCALPDGALEGLDLVLLSHRHPDHLHRPSLERIDRAATVVVPAGEAGADGLGFRRVVELEPNETLTVAGVEITAVPVRHRVGLFGRGPATGYVIRGDGPTAFFAGDTGYFEGLAEVGERFRPDVALLPISGYRPRALRRDHLSPLDAVYAFEDLGAQLFVPIHHSSFPLGYEALSEPLTWLHSLESARKLSGRIAWLEPGASMVTRRDAALQRAEATASLAAPNAGAGT
jgi:L-ascorbate metabolism protein UlaG (beta-lactamase superfamily)